MTEQEGTEYYWNSCLTSTEERWESIFRNKDLWPAASYCPLEQAYNTLTRSLQYFHSTNKTKRMPNIGI